MTSAPSESSTPPRHVVVVGAGMVGLSTAWFLQERGAAVTVIDRVGVAAGASWGNAGWVCPGLVSPLPEPSVLRYGLRALFDPSAALYVPPTIDVGLWRFLVGFATHCTTTQWTRSMKGYLDVNRRALEAFDDLRAGGIAAPANDAPIMMAFQHADEAEAMRHELEQFARLGQALDVTELRGDAIHAAAPQVASGTQLVLQLNGQRYIDPGDYVNQLAAAVIQRGGSIRSPMHVDSVRRQAKGVIVLAREGSVHADAAVVATGSWFNGLTSSLGVRRRVQAGRGYSFSVATDVPVPAPLYLPTSRVACTPYRGGMRVGGTMEFRSVDAPIDPKRVAALVKSAKPLITGVDWDSISDEWVGSRPVGVDGLPFVGATKVPGVFVAGGHGMWGITLGPITGKLLAEEMMTGVRPAALRPFDPLR
ncbi:MAG TPA: FAD-binding oxidoreductase [Acidimicrobiales bacterium]|nr:FAD-binding oxidoreductase [Acidimicrobiales bacterium]